ncbi:MAG: HDOD domain-containing protein [Pirellulales bacterium]
MSAATEPKSPAKPSIVQQFVDRAGQLYSLPAVAMEVLELTNNPAVDATQIKQCIEHDPALTTKILKVVNSPVFGLSGKVSDLNQALALLGIKPLKMLVLGFSLPKNLYADVDEHALKYYWQRSLTKAVAARELAELLKAKVGDEAFIAGLLSDLGMMVLLKDLGQPYAQFLKKSQTESVELLHLELETLGFDHIVLSSRLLQHWGPPESIVQAINDSTMSSKSQSANAPINNMKPTSELQQVVSLAEIITKLLVDQQTGCLSELVAGLNQCGSYTQEEIEALTQSIELKVTQLANAMSVDLPENVDFTKIMLQAYTALAAMTEDVSLELASHDPATQDLHKSWKEATELSSMVQNYCPANVPTPTDHSQNKPTPTGPYSHPTIQTQQQATIITDVALLGKINTAVDNSRIQRQPLSLLSLQVDGYETLILQQGLVESEKVMQLLVTVVNAITESEGDCLEVNNGQLTFLLEDHDRTHAVRAARHLVEGVQLWSQQRTTNGQSAITLSAGVSTVAMPPKNFAAEPLVEAAHRCMLAVQQGGGNGVKSIEIL